MASAGGLLRDDQWRLLGGLALISAMPLRFPLRCGQSRQVLNWHGTWGFRRLIIKLDSEVATCHLTLNQEGRGWNLSIHFEGHYQCLALNYAFTVFAIRYTLF